jgi:hypothetical protein
MCLACSSPSRSQGHIAFDSSDWLDAVVGQPRPRHCSLAIDISVLTFAVSTSEVRVLALKLSCQRKRQTAQLLRRGTTSESISVC